MKEQIKVSVVRENGVDYIIAADSASRKKFVNEFGADFGVKYSDDLGGCRGWLLIDLPDILLEYWEVLFVR